MILIGRRRRQEGGRRERREGRKKNRSGYNRDKTSCRQENDAVVPSRVPRKVGSYVHKSQEIHVEEEGFPLQTTCDQLFYEGGQHLFG